MKKVLFGIFAHPDDEAFGPSATLYKAAQNGIDVHLIVVTDGDSGLNVDGHKDLASIRRTEWQKSGTLIGARSMKALGYSDGKLCNDMYHAISDEIIEHITSVIATYSDEISIDFMTFEPQGISGHLDHIAVSMITTYIYETLRQKNYNAATIDTLKYFCLSHTMQPQANTNWVYMPAGRAVAAIDESVDYNDCAQKKLEIMSVHHTQRHDMEQILQSRAHIPKSKRNVDHFYYHT